MAKPPPSPPKSDIEGVTQDGTGPSRPLPPEGQDGGDLERAKRQSKARPDYSDDRSTDDRTR